MKHESPPKHLLVDALARSGARVHGQDLLANYPRLMQETLGRGAANPLHWSARGSLEQGASVEQVWLHVGVDVALPLTCQRCLLPTEVAVSIQRSLRFVATQEEAQEQDAQAQEDVLALSADFSLLELIEDEVLLDLPLIPRHEVCPVALKLTAVDPGFELASRQRKAPFAILGQLKSSKAK